MALSTPSVNWQERAAAYNHLEWATRPAYLDFFVTRPGFRNTEKVLDVGCGTGLVAAALEPLVKEVIGIDSSPAMVAIARHSHPRLRFLLADVRNLPFPAASFDAVTARMVVHHLIEGLEEAVTECIRVLNPGGRLIISEGCPPAAAVIPEYRRIFALKEERLVFMPGDLEDLVTSAGLTLVFSQTHREPRISIKNWLDNSSLAPALSAEIYRLHREATPAFKKAYNLVATPDDCLVDFTFHTVIGQLEPV